MYSGEWKHSEILPLLEIGEQRRCEKWSKIRASATLVPIPMTWTLLRSDSAISRIEYPSGLPSRPLILYYAVCLRDYLVQRPCNPASHHKYAYLMPATLVPPCNCRVLLMEGHLSRWCHPRQTAWTSTAAACLRPSRNISSCCRAFSLPEEWRSMDNRQKVIKSPNTKKNHDPGLQ